MTYPFRTKQDTSCVPINAITSLAQFASFHFHKGEAHLYFFRPLFYGGVEQFIIAMDRLKIVVVVFVISATLRKYMKMCVCNCLCMHVCVYAYISAVSLYQETNYENYEDVDSVRYPQKVPLLNTVQRTPYPGLLVLGYCESRFVSQKSTTIL